MRKGFITFCVLSSISSTAFASIPQQVYDDLKFLEDSNYIEQKDVSAYDRKQMAYYIAGILEKPQKYDPIISSRILEDEAQLVLIKEQEHSAKKKLDKIQVEYKNVSEKLYRKSIQGKNRLEVMTLLKERHDVLKKQFEESCFEYDQAKGRTKRLEVMIEKLKERQYNPKIDVALANLRTEFIYELTEMNYFDDEAAKRQLYANSPVRDIIEDKLKLDAQVMLSYSGHHGDEHPDKQWKLKANVYGDYNFDRKWHLISGVEAEKYLSPSSDTKFELKNLYVKGEFDKNLNVTAGKFSTSLGEGNIFDGTLKGAAVYGENYRIEKGTYEDSNITGITLMKDRFSLGRYDFTNPDKTVYMLGKHVPVDKWDFGGMFLKGKNNNGYVLSVEYDKHNWEEKSSSYWLKYYHQPSDTYYKHEMNGLADFMLPNDGFKGWGIGWRYVPKKQWAFGLEYYRLNNLLNNKSSNTLFAYLTYSFQNYSE